VFETVEVKCRVVSLRPCCLLLLYESGTTARLRSELAIHRLLDVRNERNNAALHTTEIAVASASAAEIE
jgi:hypothetical protein